VRRQATVTAVDTATGTMTIQPFGDPTPLPSIPCLASYTPSVNDVVWFDKFETDWLIVGAQIPILSPPRGVLMEARRTSDVTIGIGSTVDVTNLSLTFDAWPGRTYKLTGEVMFESTVADDFGFLYLTDGSNNVLKQSNSGKVGANLGTGLHVERTFSTLTGSNTFKLRAARNSGSAAKISASAGNPSFIRLDDLGAAVTYL
jgi:hypothetical protein